MKEKINIVHVGVSGIPYVKSAAVNRCIAIYSVFSENTYNVLVINKRSLAKIDPTSKVEREGKHLNINFQFTSPKLFKPKKFVDRRLNNFFGLINEFKLIFKLGLKKDIHFMFFYPSGNFFELLYYRFFSKIFRFPLVAHYVEYRSKFEKRTKVWDKINDQLFDRYFIFFVDGVIPISEFLINKTNKHNKNLLTLKIPPLVDFNQFRKDKNNLDKYFLYVGSIGYMKAIDLILESFELINNNTYYLFLVLNGKNEYILKKINKHRKSKLIRVFSNLDYSVLIRFYINAKSLLIPLSNSVQDKARFPQKISEYLASGNPIITTNFGEIRYYFKDGENALVASENTPFEIAGKMRFVIDNPIASKIIGRKGYNTGLKYFDNNSYGAELENFVLEAINSQKQ